MHNNNKKNELKVTVSQVFERSLSVSRKKATLFPENQISRFNLSSTRAGICDIVAHRVERGERRGGAVVSQRGRIRLKKSLGSYQRRAGNLGGADAFDHRR